VLEHRPAVRDFGAREWSTRSLKAQAGLKTRLDVLASRLYETAVGKRHHTLGGRLTLLERQGERELVAVFFWFCFC
jgi:hypothetical protein